MPSSTPPEVHHRQKRSLQQRSPLQTSFRRLRSSSPLPAATPTALPSSTEQMNLRTTQFRKRGRSLSCLLTLYIGYYYLLLYRSILSFELPMGLISSQQRIVYVYYLVHLGSSMWFMLGGQQTIDDPLSIFLNWSYNLPAIISFGSIHSFATISLDFCMHPLGLTKSNYFFIMHVRYCTQSYWTCREKEKTVACEYNVMQTPLHGGRSAPPPAFPDCIPEEDNCSDGDSEGADHACLPPEVFALTWHADVGHIMHMAPCIAYIIHLICHQLSLDLLCVNATCLVSISYSHRS